MTAPAADDLTTGDEVEVEVGAIAHGGHCVARYDGRVLFVRHGLPGERVRARITEGGPGDRFLRADAVSVLEASPHRIAPRCAAAGPGGCGGCDFQHVATAHQRELKAAVVAEQLQRLAGIEREVVVEPLDDADGLRYRTRVEFAVVEGRIGLRRHRSHDVVEVDGCPIAVPDVDEALRETRAESVGELEGIRAIDVVVPSGESDTVVVEVPQEAPTPPIEVTEIVRTPAGERSMTVDARGFWQVHRDAPHAFVAAMLEAADVRPGERVLDLYSGVGLLSVPLADAVGATGQLIAVESDRRATEHLRDNLAAHPWALVVPGRVDDLLGVPRQGRRRGPRRPARSDLLPPSAHVVVLDPPRTGAGRGVVAALTSLRPRRLVYVACDPAALARDTAYLGELGYELTALRAFDAFPMTHHVECVATFEPKGEAATS
ncbi:class I SAM-dependent RNA methyltransferase [Janibacter hoylei]|uniref:Class I SAM-dependent RNA methyltransferase n=1 Tax=Janibacter hoylei PVAS-1 TaxID=1210046 RepID=K1E4N4_9MICO|nr:TRAM domain-containing protein [Janibacter hoylei]EKA62056.1 RNA methyltransferase, TrmA family protein [Janibacter hoylei PVAS-1]MCT1619745.1 class I SAM-dependent RNA methyltransferase [Janibacter hoylei]MCT2294129.1 class I SAM-dependent RNA methyltransferase [Janibacter hoylei]RWU83744.1 class I SAM-dependent RNA methyltransferase [Janibacter hoylei PVAS-1]